jgi:chromate reductase, NAD(P)H dehydrogenase (quinone)
MRVLGISGSLRQGSHNDTLLRAAGDLLPAEAELVVWERLRDVPPYDEDAETPAPFAVADLKAAIAGADAVVFATPEYNHSIPGQLKNAIDWISRPMAANPLRGKPVLVVGASTGLFGAVWAQAELRKVLASLGARVLDRELPVGQAAEALGAGELPAELGDALGEQVGALCALCRERALAA